MSDKVVLNDDVSTPPPRLPQRQAHSLELGGEGGYDCPHTHPHSPPTLTPQVASTLPNASTSSVPRANTMIAAPDAPGSNPNPAATTAPLATALTSGAGPAATLGPAAGTGGGTTINGTGTAGTGDAEQTISYSAERIIGNGSFGVVFQATVVETGDVVAIKKVLQDKRFKNRELQVRDKPRTSGGALEDGTDATCTQVASRSPRFPLFTPPFQSFSPAHPALPRS